MNEGVGDGFAYRVRAVGDRQILGIEEDDCHSGGATRGNADVIDTADPANPGRIVNVTSGNGAPPYRLLDRSILKVLPAAPRMSIKLSAGQN